VARVKDMRRAEAWPQGQWEGQWVVQQGWQEGTEYGEAAREAYEEVHGGEGGDGQEWEEHHEHGATHVYACVEGASDGMKGRREGSREPPHTQGNTNGDRTDEAGRERLTERGTAQAETGADGGQGAGKEVMGVGEEEAAPESRQEREEEAAEEERDAPEEADASYEGEDDEGAEGMRAGDGGEEGESVTREAGRPQQQEAAAAAALATMPGKRQRVGRGRVETAGGCATQGRGTRRAAPGGTSGGGGGTPEQERGRGGASGADRRTRTGHASLVERFVCIIEEERRKSEGAAGDGTGKRSRGAHEVTRAEQEAHERRKRKAPRGVFQKKRAKGEDREAGGSTDVVEQGAGEEHGGAKRNCTGVAQRWSVSAYRAYKAAMREKDGDVDRGEP